ncbi:D-glycero-alpha-D-manno-heptose-1,7-bisphosphate 7-phosphatase [Kribbella sp. NPDC059898]|uniref:D-glycero-alpha-D-manno-heptose-1,7-bisphosphate 7-phosphatase n=1 Tax=Kribbella sp. NPDC059898 TaxID=3346995 RepID=UPI0036471B1D
MRTLVLFDRDGTLVEDVPYNGDAERVVPMPTARAALDQLRAAGILVGVATNQSGISRGLVTAAQVDAVNARVELLLGPFDVWQVCPHAPEDGCRCRKPRPGMVLAACAAVGVAPRGCVLVGDRSTDVEAATAAGGTGILVAGPTSGIGAAGLVCAGLSEAADLVLGGCR